VGVRISRDTVDEVQDPGTLPPARLVPYPVSQHTGKDSQEERGQEAQVPVPCERPGRKQKQRSGYWETYLVRE
jgi:hypothetical protein